MAASGPAMTQAIRRLKRDLDHLEKNPNSQFLVRPSSKSMLEWHFVLRGLPAETPYSGGVYHGKLTFPETYPMAPPALVMLTPNGRLQTNQRLCLSMTDFHPESWNPAWTVESLLVGLVSFLVDDRDTTGYGSMTEPLEVRQALALKSWQFNRKSAEFRELFPEIPEAPATSSSESAGEQGGSDALPPSEPTAPSGGASGSNAASVDAAAVAEADSGWVDITFAETPDAQEGIAAPVPLSLHVPSIGAARSLGEALEEGAESRRRALGEDLAEEAERGLSPPAKHIASESQKAGQDLASGSAAATGEPEAEAGPAMVPQASCEECWICREDASAEPLIQPCECRGSMSGVHASCVEAWIAHHRTNADRNEMPKCSVCGVTYMGEERRPGVLCFFRHICVDFLRQAARSALLVALLVCYWAAAQPAIVPSLTTRIILLSISGGFFLYKALVLTVSVPRGRPPPTGIDRFLFTADFRSLAVILAELLAIVLISILWCLYGHLHYTFVIPLLALPVFPMLTLLVNGHATPLRSLLFIITIIASPILVTVQMMQLVYRNPKRLVDPFDGVLHVAVPVVTVFLSWLSRSSSPVISLWSCHGTIMFLGILEKTVGRVVHWKEGRAWWIFAQLAVLAAYIANLMYNFSSAEEQATFGFFILSMIWLGLCCTLAVIVNWGICVQQYRAWQQRNGQFSLAQRNSPRAGGSSPGAGNAAEGGQVIGRGQEQDAAVPPV